MPALPRGDRWVPGRAHPANDSGNIADMKKSLLLSALALMLVTALAGASCSSSKKHEEGATTPRQSTTSATATASYEEDIDGAINQLFWDYEHVKDVTIDRTIRYTDSLGTAWVTFNAHVTRGSICRAGPQPGATGPVSGLLKRALGETWELVNLGVGDIQCGVPADVQSGLGFGVCPASEDELNNAIERFVLSRSNMKATDVKISRKAYYTDPSGTDWVEFCILGIRSMTTPSYGFMKKVPGTKWEGVSGAGTYQVECGLPEDVQSGLGFPYCPHG